MLRSIWSALGDYAITPVYNTARILVRPFFRDSPTPDDEQVTEESQSEASSSSSTSSSLVRESCSYDTVFEWTQGGSEVYLLILICGEEQSVIMRKRGKKFICIKSLERDEKYKHRFLVDG
jgi:hypothetical protein